MAAKKVLLAFPLLLILTFVFAFGIMPSPAFADETLITGSAQFGSEVSLTTAASDTSASRQPLYRLYQPKTGEHHYTLDAYERDVCVARWGWRYEGVAWHCPSTGSQPVYRLYNRSSGLHHYTLDAHERDVCVAQWGWTYEGIAWYSDDAKGAPLYRLYQPSSGHHHYTLDAHERDVCVAQWGWRYEGVAWYGMGSETEASVTGSYFIMGTSQTSVAQMVRRYNATGKAYPSSVYAQYGATTIEQFCQILYEEATAEGVRAEVVFAQAMHETGWLQFGGDVKANQCNFAGIGATGGGNPGNSFNDWGANSVRKGLRAQVQHLKAYASKDPCVNAVVDPRFTYVTRGCAPTVESLGGKWATSAAYGDALVNQIKALLAA